MNIKGIRRANVQRLIRDRFKGNKAAFARAINRPPPNVIRMLVDPGKSVGGKDQRGIGEELARDIEKCLGLEAGFLDNPNYVGPDGNATMSVFVSANPSPQIGTPKRTMIDIMDELSEQIAKADPSVRDEIARLVMSYIDKPEGKSRIAQAIKALLSDHADPGI